MRSCVMLDDLPLLTALKPYGFWARLRASHNAEDLQVPGLFWRLFYLLTNPPALPYCLYLWPNDRNSVLRALSSTLSFRCCPHLTAVANRARIISMRPPTHCGSATETTAGTEISYHLFPAGPTVLVATLSAKHWCTFTTKK